MIDHKDYNPEINHHVKPFRNRKLGEFESMDLVMYKYIPLDYVLNMLETKKFRFNNIKTWEDVYENFVNKEDIKLLNSTWDGLPCFACYGQSWTIQKESDAMWRIYSQAGQAVRIMTSYRYLYHTIYDWNRKHSDNPLWPLIDYVFYADENEINEWLLSNSPMTFFVFVELLGESVFIKRCEFEHEKEVRVVFRNVEKEEKKYIEFDFDPNYVFREIVIDPRVNKEEFIRQRDSLVNCGFDIKRIRKSTLYDFKKVKLNIDMSEPWDLSD